MIVDKSKFWMTADFETITLDWNKILNKKPREKVRPSEIHEYYNTTENPIYPQVYLWSVVASIERKRNIVMPKDLDIDYKITDTHIIAKGITIKSFLLFFKAQHYTWYVYFHNLKGFDGHYILPALIKLGIAKQQSKEMMEAHEKLEIDEFRAMIEKNKMIYQIDWRIADHSEKNNGTRKTARFIKFCDNLLMFMTSVKEMGNQLANHFIARGMDQQEAELKYHKQSINYFRKDMYHDLAEAKADSVVYDYVEQDSFIVFEFRKMMMEMIDPIFPAKDWGMTAGSTAVRHWTQVYGDALIKKKSKLIRPFQQKNGGYLYQYGKSKKNLGIRALRNKLIDEVIPTKWLDDEVEGIAKWVDIYEYYNGGLTKINERYRGIFTENVRILDIVSSYPTIMNSDLPVPIGKPVVNGDFKLYLVKTKFDLHNDKGLPFIPFIDELGREWRAHIGAGKVIPLSSANWNEFLKYYKVQPKDLEIKIDYSFKTGKFKDIFGDYIKLWYKIKDDAKKQGNEFLKQFAKIMLNALYGKFGTKRNHVGYYLDKGDNYLDIMEELKSKFYLPIAIAITDYARMRLVNAVQNDYKDFLYADTDSIFITDNLYQKIISEKRISLGEKLGDWELENKHSYKFFGRRPKQYRASCQIGGDTCVECKKPVKMAFAGINFLQHEQVWSDDHEWTDTEIRFRDTTTFKHFMYGRKIPNQIQPMLLSGYGKILYEQVKEIKPLWDKTYKPKTEQIYKTKTQWLKHPNNYVIINS